jgi:hypothetical protein
MRIQIRNTGIHDLVPSQWQPGSPGQELVRSSAITDLVSNTGHQDMSPRQKRSLYETFVEQLWLGCRGGVTKHPYP